MAQVNYITLNGKKYVTPAKSWKPMPVKPASVRYTLTGRMDATYGAAVLLQWDGEIEAAVTPATGYGSVADLDAACALRGTMAFTDHDGNNYTVHLLGPFPKRSLGNKWDAPGNKVYVTVSIRSVQ